MDYTTEVTPEVLEASEAIHDGWYAEESRIDWVEFLDRLDGTKLEDGTVLDLGNDLTSDGIRKIKAHIRVYRKS